MERWVKPVEFLLRRRPRRGLWGHLSREVPPERVWIVLADRGNFVGRWEKGLLGVAELPISWQEAGGVGQTELAAEGGQDVGQIIQRIDLGQLARA